MTRRNTVPTANRPQGFAPAPAAATAASVIEDDYAQFSQEVPIVEHLTVPGFLRRIPHRWHLEDIHRFGDKLGKTAEALHLSYLTVIDRSLGQVRVFPRPLLERVYEIMAVQQKWPTMIEAQLLPAPSTPVGQDVKAVQRLANHLRKVLDIAPNTDVQHGTAVVLQWLESEVERLKAAEPAVAPSEPLPAG